MAGEIVIRISVPDGAAVLDVDYQGGSAFSAQHVAPATAPAVAAAQSVFGNEIGAPAPYAPAPVPTPQAAGAVPSCAAHGQMKYFPGGAISKRNGKPISASYRCAIQDCPTPPVWGV